MAVLWWLVPPLVATCLAMAWATWLGRERSEQREEDRDAALRRMERALARPAPQRGTPVGSAPIERSHGVAVRRAPRSPATMTVARR